MDAQTILIIQFLLGMTILIVYFMLAYNVGKIAKSLKKDEENLFYDYVKHLSFNDQEAAHKALNEFIWTQLHEIQLKKVLPEQRQKKYDDVKVIYEKYYKQIGKEFPPLLEYEEGNWIIKK